MTTWQVELGQPPIQGTVPLATVACEAVVLLNVIMFLTTAWHKAVGLRRGTAIDDPLVASLSASARVRQSAVVAAGLCEAGIVCVCLLAPEWGLLLATALLVGYAAALHGAGLSVCDCFGATGFIAHVHAVYRNLALATVDAATAGVVWITGLAPAPGVLALALAILVASPLVATEVLTRIGFGTSIFSGRANGGMR
jgi:hypothetical protein